MLGYDLMFFLLLDNAVTLCRDWIFRLDISIGYFDLIMRIYAPLSFLIILLSVIPKDPFQQNIEYMCNGTAIYVYEIARRLKSLVKKWTVFCELSLSTGRLYMKPFPSR
jgi:hypothetical protein